MKALIEYFGDFYFRIDHTIIASKIFNTKSISSCEKALGDPLAQGVG